ncbi:MAG: LamG domain-containing protein [Patescibacteria group bacterium]|nr:LamG domain-containing protein [Patescibacteria group bacterium]
MKQTSGLWVACGVVLTTLVVAPAVSAEAILFYRMEDSTAGSAATSLKSDGTSLTNAIAADGGGVFNADVPGAFIFDPVTNVYRPNATSVYTTSAGRFDVTGAVTQVRNFTVEAFIKTSETASFARILQKQRGGALDASWRIDPRNTTNIAIRADSNDGTYGLYNQSVNGSQNINSGQWQHLALTYTDGVAGVTPGVLNVYWDYTLAATLTMNNLGVMQYDTGLFSIAGGPGSPNGLVGLIDEVRFSNTVLAPDQFLRATAVPEPGSCALLLLAACGLAACRRRRPR